MLVLTLILNNFFSFNLQNKDQIVSVLSLVTILSFAISGIKDYKLLLKVIMVVVAIIGVLFTAYTYKKDLLYAALSRLAPNKAFSIANGTKVIISATQRGHFEVEAKINAHRILCLVDTGASGIVLDQEMIMAIGIDPTSLDYNIKTNTANGIAYAGALRVDSFVVGSINFSNVDVLVNQTSLGGSCLLGMTFLNRLQSYTVEDDRLTLIP